MTLTLADRAHKRLDYNGRFAYTITVVDPGRYIVLRLSESNPTEQEGTE